MHLRVLASTVSPMFRDAWQLHQAAKTARPGPPCESAPTYTAHQRAPAKYCNCVTHPLAGGRAAEMVARPSLASSSERPQNESSRWRARQLHRLSGPSLLRADRVVMRRAERHQVAHVVAAWTTTAEAVDVVDMLGGVSQSGHCRSGCGGACGREFFQRRQRASVASGGEGCNRRSPKPHQGRPQWRGKEGRHERRARRTNAPLHRPGGQVARAARGDHAAPGRTRRG